MREPSFAPLHRREGYLPLADHGLVGDGHTAALVARDGGVPWLCVPRFDDDALLCGLLDRRRGGHFTVKLDDLEESRQWYEEDTAVLVTEQRGASGTLRIVDAMGVDDDADLTTNARPATAELVRRVEVLHGPVTVVVDLAPRGGAETEPIDGGLRLRWRRNPRLPLRLLASRRLDGLRSRHGLDRGERLELILTWREDAAADALEVERTLERTRHAWRRWIGEVHYTGPREREVRRSALTLKQLDYIPNGAVLAAPTSSLPETIGGERNWDYRYTWIRDTAFAVYALRRIGMSREADAFLHWVLDVAEHGERPAVCYDVDGRVPGREVIDDELEGYRRSRPVRWGNAAAEQSQHDVLGELLDCAYQWVHAGGRLEEHHWRFLRPLVERAADAWDTSDHGVWEVRTSGAPFTYSAALCSVALERGASLAESSALGGDVASWRRDAERIREAVLREAWNDDLGALAGRLGGDFLDASILSLPLRRVIDADHPKMRATTEAVVARLGAGDGLVYRYLPDELDDGLEGHEGAFLLCSFWLVDNLANQHRLDEALELYESLCDRGGALGLLPEEIDPSDGLFLGNYPQALSHIGLVSSGVTLGRRLAEHREGAGHHPDEEHEAFRTATAAGAPHSKGAS